LASIASATPPGCVTPDTSRHQARHLKAGLHGVQDSTLGPPGGLLPGVWLGRITDFGD